MTQPPADTSTAPVGDITRISNETVAGWAALSPLLATYSGIAGHDDQLDDLSPDGQQAVHDLLRSSRSALAAAVPTDRPEEVARTVVLERLDAAIEGYDSGWQQVSLNVLASPLQEIRQVFDLMGTETEQDRQVLARRLRAVPDSLRGYTESLREGIGRDRVSAARQVAKVAEQARTFGGGFFTGFVDGIGADGSLGTDLATAARAADTAFLDLGEFLQTELLPVAPTADAIGAERYAVQSREFLGASLDLAETYAWGWQEFLRLEQEMIEVAERVAPGAGPKGAAAALDADPRYQVSGTAGLQSWMQDLSDRAIEELGRDHFAIDPELRTLACRVAPPGGSLGAYYTGPADDFSRPGTMWWSVDHSREAFSTWRETTTVYHEGVPGHHLQIATAVHRRDRLNDYQRLLSFTSGHGEGWALYAERLVAELGYLDDDGDRMGLLDSQTFRAARVVLDIGMHLGLTIPAGTGFHEGETWTPALGLEFLTTRTLTEPDYARDEIDRYLGWGGQAPAYKVGERVWLAGRERARVRHGADFDLKTFHTEALALGGMGLGPLEQLLDTL